MACLWCGEAVPSPGDFCSSQCNVVYTDYMAGGAGVWNGRQFTPYVIPAKSPLRFKAGFRSRNPPDLDDPDPDPAVPRDDYDLYIEKLEDGVTSV